MPTTVGEVEKLSCGRQLALVAGEREALGIDGTGSPSLSPWAPTPLLVGVATGSGREVELPTRRATWRNEYQCRVATLLGAWRVTL